jgi:hypothetical protein
MAIQRRHCERRLSELYLFGSTTPAHLPVFRQHTRRVPGPTGAGMSAGKVQADKYTTDTHPPVFGAKSFKVLDGYKDQP